MWYRRLGVGVCSWGKKKKKKKKGVVGAGDEYLEVTVLSRKDVERWLWVAVQLEMYIDDYNF